MSFLKALKTSFDLIIQCSGLRVNAETEVYSNPVRLGMTTKRRSPQKVIDGHSDVDDLLSVIREWGPAIPTTTADFDLDGAVDMDDLLTVLEEWG